MRAFVMLGFVFPCQTKRLVWGRLQKWPILCRVGRKTLTLFHPPLSRRTRKMPFRIWCP